MKKIISLIIVTALLLSAILLLSSCGNRQMFDTTNNFNYAYVVWPDGTAEKLEIQSWTDYEGEQIQIRLVTGETYLFHASNCVLASE